ncbi:hypothetical protein Trydic_g11226 [Trypoxylus dichotomus]
MGGRSPLFLLPPPPPPVKRGHKPVFNIIAGDSSATAARVRCLSPRLTSRNRTFQVPLNPIAAATATGRRGDPPPFNSSSSQPIPATIPAPLSTPIPAAHLPPPPLPPHLAPHSGTPE